MTNTQGSLPPIDEVRARQVVHVAEADCRAIARTIRLAEISGMDAITLTALGQLLNQATDHRDQLQQQYRARARRPIPVTTWAPDGRSQVTK